MWYTKLRYGDQQCQWLSGVPLPPVGQLSWAVPYGQGAAAAIAEEETTLSPPADQAVTGDEEDGSGGVEDNNDGDSNGN